MEVGKENRTPSPIPFVSEATTHNDSSHDQSLDQKIPFLGKFLHFVGGTTKCARVALRYFEDKSSEFKGKRVVEVGSGTGLVGIGLYHLGVTPPTHRIATTLIRLVSCAYRSKRYCNGSEHCVGATLMCRLCFH